MLLQWTPVNTITVNRIRILVESNILVVPASLSVLKCAGLVNQLLNRIKSQCLEVISLSTQKRNIIICITPCINI